jgi:hypothetical protein
MRNRRGPVLHFLIEYDFHFDFEEIFHRINEQARFEGTFNSKMLMMPTNELDVVLLHTIKTSRSKQGSESYQMRPMVISASRTPRSNKKTRGGKEREGDAVIQQVQVHSSTHHPH